MLGRCERNRYDIKDTTLSKKTPCWCRSSRQSFLLSSEERPLRSALGLRRAFGIRVMVDRLQWLFKRYHTKNRLSRTFFIFFANLIKSMTCGRPFRLFGRVFLPHFYPVLNVGNSKHCIKIVLILGLCEIKKAPREYQGSITEQEKKCHFFSFEVQAFQIVFEKKLNVQYCERF